MMFSRDDMTTMKDLLPYVEQYISKNQEVTEQIENLRAKTENEIPVDGDLTETRPQNELLINWQLKKYPYTFSNLLKLQFGNKKTHRCDKFKIQKINLCDDPASVISYRDGEIGGQRSEIWYTPTGFFAAFDHSESVFARKVRKLKNSFINMAMENLASRNKNAKEMDALIALKNMEIESMYKSNQAEVQLLEFDIKKKKTKLDISEISAFKRVMKLCGLTYSKNWVKRVKPDASSRFWAVWRRAKYRGFVKRPRGERSNYQIESRELSTFDNAIAAIILKYDTSRS